MLKDVSKKMISEKYEIILIENNGMRNTYLDKLGCKVFYTNNNLLPTQNRGRKELQDIFDCIRYFKINDDDFKFCSSTFHEVINCPYVLLIYFS